MKKILLLGVLFCAAAPLFAQKVFFVFIQSDAGNAFYVKMNDKVLSSTASGYLIIPRLKDSTYSFQLGPAPSEGELRFEVAIAQKDRGFLLKKFSEGWGLFDLQTMAVVKPLNAGTGFSNAEKIKDNPFVQLLARAADDTSLLYQPIMASQTSVAKKNESTKVVEDVAATAPPADNAVAANELNITATLPADSPAVVAASKENIEDTLQQEKVSDIVTVNENDTQQAVEVKEESEEVPYKRSVVMRRAESSTVDGFGLVFWDKTDDAVDTIKIFIPNQKVAFGNNEADAVQAPVIAVKKTVTACNDAASEKDFFRVRKNLVAFDTEEEMVAEAKNIFRKKCFSSDQIKSLSSLFLTQQGKWLFLETAYPFVSDKTAFSALQSELHDEAYLARFKALTNQ